MVRQLNIDIPVYVIKRENGLGGTRKVHRNLLLSVNHLPMESCQDKQKGPMHKTRKRLQKTTSNTAGESQSLTQEARSDSESDYSESEAEWVTVQQPTDAKNQQPVDEPVQQSSGADSDQGEVEGTDEEEEDELGRIVVDRENSGSKSQPVPAPHRSIRKEGAGKERENDWGKSDADREKSASKPQPVPAPCRPVRASGASLEVLWRIPV